MPGPDAIRPSPLPAFRTAALAALVTAGLSFPVVLYGTDQGFSNELVLRSRPALAALLCLMAALAALAVRLRLWRGADEGGFTPGPRAALVLGIPAALLAALAAAETLVGSGAGRLTLLLPGAALLVFAAQAYLWPSLRRASASGRSRAMFEPLRALPLGPLFLVGALVFPLLASLAKGGLGESRYLVDTATLVLIYVMLGWGLNIVVGLAGLLDLGYVAFYAVGAYTYALLATAEPVQGFMAALLGEGTWRLWAFWIVLPAAGLLAALWGVVIGFPVLRLRGDYLAVVTLAFAEIVRTVLVNWGEVTGGSAGVSSIPPLSFFGIPFTPDEGGFAARFGLAFDAMHRLLFQYYLILGLALLTLAVTFRLRRLPIGRAWEALRENEIAARSLGLDITRIKLAAFALGALFAGMAGAFFAARQRLVSPESFTFTESVTVLAIVVLGGMGSPLGIAVAALVVVAAPEALRELGALQSVFGEGFDPNQYRPLLFGLAMVAVMIWRPRGFVGERTPTVRLGRRPRPATGDHVAAAQA